MFVVIYGMSGSGKSTIS
jgi:uridine kinase